MNNNEYVAIPENNTITKKVVKKHYPRQNNKQILDFVFSRDKNLYLRKNNIIIKGSIAVDKSYVPDVGFVSKLFGMLTVEVDSVTVSNNKARYTNNIFYFIYLNHFRGEYFLMDYMEKIGNFNAGYIDTVFALEGYNDLKNYSSKDLVTYFKNDINKRHMNAATISGDKYVYDFVFIPNCGFLNSNLPLMTDCELKLSFDRTKSDVSMIKTLSEVKDICDGEPIEIQNCVAIAEYVGSDELDDYFMKVDTEPIPYYYEDCEITLKTLPLNETEIRIDNIKGGPTPSCMFAGIIQSEALAGNMALSSTSFRCNNVTGFDITLNGNSVNGYPLENKNKLAVFPYHKFMETTGRYMNTICGEGLKLTQFMVNWIYAHKFEAEVSEEGWLGINIRLSEAYTEAFTLVIWCIYDAAITIDKFHQIEKLSL